MDKAQATDYIITLLGKAFWITTTDTRMFLGQFKCTDADCNVVLDQTYEYRPLSGMDPCSIVHIETSSDLKPRYLGLVVIPGKHITRIQIEEFVSQLPPPRLKESS